MNKSTCFTLKSETGLWKRKYCSFFLPLAATSQMYRYICLEQLVDRHGAVSQEHKIWMPMPIVFMLQQIFNLVVFFFPFPPFLQGGMLWQLTFPWTFFSFQDCGRFSTGTAEARQGIWRGAGNVCNHLKDRMLTLPEAKISAENEWLEFGI